MCLKKDFIIPLFQSPEWDDNLLASQKSKLNNMDETMSMAR